MIKYFPKKQREGRQLRSGRPVPTLSCVPEGEWFTTDRGQAFGERAGGGRRGEERGPARAQTAVRAGLSPDAQGDSGADVRPGNLSRCRHGHRPGVPRTSQSLAEGAPVQSGRRTRVLGHDHVLTSG